MDESSPEYKQQQGMRGGAVSVVVAAVSVSVAAVGVHVAVRVVVGGAVVVMLTLCFVFVHTQVMRAAVLLWQGQVVHREGDGVKREEM